MDDPVNGTDTSGTGGPGAACGVPGYLAPGVRCVPLPPNSFYVDENFMELVLQFLDPSLRRQYYVKNCSAINRTTCIASTRFYDLYDPQSGTAYELKVGNQSANSRNLQQISFDTWALGHPQQNTTSLGKPANIRTVEWLQFPTFGDLISGVSLSLLSQLSIAYYLTGGKYTSVIFYSTPIKLI